MKLFTTAREVRSAIQRLLRDQKDDRVVIVAFVGADALSYLPSPKGLVVYCWPKAGGTNPHGIDKLLAAGVNVRFVDRLHAKIYWARRSGILIGSANLSANALGEGGLQESMILLPSRNIELRSLVNSLRVIGDFDLALRTLHTEHVRFLQRNPASRSREDRTPLPRFTQWFDRRGRAEWRIGWYDEDVDPPRDAEKDFEQQSGTANYVTFLAVSRPHDLSAGIFTLGFRARATPEGVVRVSEVHWWVPEVRVRTSTNEWRKWPYLWFASRWKPRGARPPFDCRERRFRDALAATINALGGLRMLKSASTTPTNRFLSRLAREYTHT